MKLRTRAVVGLFLAVFAFFLSPGCTNTTNEAGAGNALTAGGPPPANAPKTQAEYFKQQQEAVAKAKAAAKKGGRSAR